MTMNSRLLNLWALCLLSISAIAHTPQKDTPASQSLFDVLQHQSVQKVKLEMDLNALELNRKSADEIPAQFSFTNADGFPQTLSVSVRTRGRFRRRVCTDMPPLKLNFKKGELKEAGLQKFDSYKLVTHCLNDDKSRDNVLKEFLAYQMYEKLTKYSFRTQLFEISYIDSKTGEEMNQVGFFIEDTDELEKRLGATQIKDQFGQTLADLDENNAMLSTMFQYMIGNVDWEIASFRNLKMMQPADKALPVIIPYDFDFAGLVNASYARPNYQIGQKIVTQRVFMGNDLEDASWKKIKRYFKIKKEELLQTVDECPLLSRKVKRESKQYIQTFFDQLDDMNV